MGVKLIWCLWLSHLFDICDGHTLFDICYYHNYFVLVTVTLTWYLWLSHLLDVCDCHTYLMFVTVSLIQYFWVLHFCYICKFHTYLTLWMSHLSDILDYHYFTLVCLSDLFENWSCNTYIQMNLASWFILNVSYIQRLNFSVSYLYMTLASDVSYLKMSPTCRCLLPADVSYL